MVIERFEEGIFYANIYISDGITERKIDSRASDAVALALAQQVPIYTTQAVLDETGLAGDTFLDDDDTMENENTNIEDLEQQLKILERNEEYEKAAELLDKINRLKSERKEYN